MIKYRILLEKKGHEMDFLYTADDGRIFLSSMTVEELDELINMCLIALKQIELVKSTKEWKEND